MKLKWQRLLVAFYGFFFVMKILRQLLLSSKKLDVFLSNPMEGAIILMMSSLILLAYTAAAYLTLFRRYTKQPKWVTAITITFIALGVIGLRYFVEEAMMRALLGYGNYNVGTTALYYVSDNVYYWLFRFVLCQ